MLRRTFFSTVLSTVALLLVALSSVACGGGGGTDPVIPPPPDTGVKVTNGALDSMGGPNTQVLTQVILTSPGNPAIDVQGLSIPVGGTQLIPVTIPAGSTTITVQVHLIRYANSVILGPIVPPVPIILSEGDTPTYVAIYPVPTPP